MKGRNGQQGALTPSFPGVSPLGLLSSSAGGLKIDATRGPSELGRGICQGLSALISQKPLCQAWRLTHLASRNTRPEARALFPQALFPPLSLSKPRAHRRLALDHVSNHRETCWQR